MIENIFEKICYGIIILITLILIISFFELIVLGAGSLFVGSMILIESSVFIGLKILYFVFVIWFIGFIFSKF